MAVFTLTPGTDNFTGLPGEDNTFNFTQLTLQPTDTITGGAAGSFIDILALTSVGTITAAQFAGVTNFEQLSLFAPGTITLSNGFVANSSRAGGRMLIVGSSGNDTIDGSQITNVVGLDVFAQDGDDTVIGGNGDDTLVGHTVVNVFAAEHDSLSGGAGNDTLFGEAADTLSGGAGFDVLQVINDFAMNLDLDATGIEYVVSGFGNDIYTAAAAIVTIEVYGGGGNDQITGGTVDDNLWAGVGNDTLVGNDGADLLVGDLGADSLSGGAGNDRLYIDSDDNFIDGGTGFDAAYIATGTGVTLNMATSQLEWATDFAGGNDTITAAGVAVGVEIYAGAGTDNLTGSSNSDLIFAGSGNDTVAGGDGADAIVGETGADSLSGGAGNDRLYVDSDDTLIDGGADTDAVYIVGGTGVTLNMATSNVEYVQDDVGAADTINGVGTGARVIAGGGDDTIGITNSAFTTISGGLGLDRLTLTTASQNFDVTANVSKLTGIEVISLSASLNATLSLTSTDIPLINATGNSLYVTGGADDTITVGGGDWVIVTLTHTNPTISGDTFIHYHNNTTNSDLYVVDSIGGGPIIGTPEQAPVNTNPASVTANEDATFAFTGLNTISVADADGDAVFVTLSVDHGVLNVTPGPGVTGNGTNTLTIALNDPSIVNPILASLTYKGDLNFNGGETLTIVTSDGTLSDTDTVAITVDPVNDAPVAVADANTAVEDLIPAVAGNVLANDTDIDGNPLTVSVAAQGLRSGTYGDLQLNSNGSYTYTLGVTVAQQAAVQALAAGDNVSDTFAYTTFDGTADSNSVDLVVTVVGTNDAPLVDVAITTQTAPEDAAFSFAIPANAFSDIDTGDTLTYTNVGPLPAWLTFNGTSYVGTPANGDVGPVTVAVRATDGSGAFAEQLFTINVTNTNDDPVAVADAAPQAVIAGTSLAVDAAHGVLANDTDVDGDTVSVSAMTGATDNGTTFTVVGDHGTLVLNKATGAYTYTALPAATLDFGTDSFSYTISDGQGGTSTSTLSIEVTEQGFRTLDTSSLDGSGNIFVGTGNTGNNYNVSTNHAAGLELGLKIHYRAGNDIQPLSRDADGTAHYLVPLGLQAIDPAHNVSAASANRVAWSFDYSVDTDATESSGKTLADYNFTITISDGEGNTQIYDLQHLSATNTPWVLRGGPGSSNFGDEETGAGATSPTLSQNSVNIGFAFLQAAFGNNLAGKHFDIQLTATDAVTGALAASVHDQLVVDTPPIATPNTASVTEDVDNDGGTAGTQTFASGNVITDAVADSDANGNPITVSAVNGSAANVNGNVAGTYGTLVINTNGSYTYTLNNSLPAVQSLGAGQTATETFTYTITDGITPNASATATLTVTVNGANDAPTLDLDIATGGDDFATLATSGDTNTAISGDTAIADAEGSIKSIVLNLTATGGTDTGEGLNLPAGYEATLEGLGIATITGAGSSLLTITATSSFSPDVAESIIEAITHANPDTTFNFNPLDRTITVTITDQNAGLSDVQTTTIDMAANVNDTTGVNSFVGANRADTIQGNTGGDVMEGAGGDDTIWGGTTAGDMDGTDIAVFSGNAPEYTVTRVDSNTYTVQDNTPGRDGLDTVHDAEILRFDDVDLVIGAPIMVFNAAGDELLATYAANQLDLAVAFADAASGANIIELRSAQGPFSAGAWPVVIDDAVTIKGVGGTALINAGANSGFVVNPSAVNGAGETVRFEQVTLDGDGTTAGTTGIKYNGVYSSAAGELGTIEIVHATITDFGSNGLYVNGGGTSLSVEIEDVAFSGSGYNSAGSGGSGDILFFEFTGNANLNGLEVTGTTGTAENGIQISGFQDGVGPANDVLTDIGNVSFTDVTVTGDYAKNLVYVQGYNDFSTLTFAGGLSLGDAGSSAAWTALFIDGGSQGGSYTLDGAVDATIDGTINLTGVAVVGGAYGTSPNFLALGSKQIVVNGTLTDDSITGTSATEAFNGLTGNDTINAGGGSDLVLYNAGHGQDIVDGQGGTDTLGLVNFNGAVPSATAATFAVSESAGRLIVQTDGAGAAEVDAAGMESLQAVLGNGGDTVTLSGNIAGAGIAAGLGGIVVTGGTGGDTLDASALTSPSAITLSNLGGGNDTFKAANVVANDTVNGAGGTGDTADYSAATAAVTINLALGTASGTSVGSDTIANYENALGGAGGDSITGTSGVNTLTGNGGFDTLTGGGDDDILIGNETGEVYTAATGEGDVAGYTGAITRSMIAEDGLGGWTVTSGEGADSLTGIEIIDGSEAGRFLLVGNGGFADFATAYAEAVDGDTIVLAGNANYSAGFTIAKSITISGVNYNTAGTGIRAAESVLTGEWSVNAAAPVVIEGVRFLNDATTTGNGIATLTLASSATVQNSVFFSTELGGLPVSASDDRAIKVTATTGTVSILNNLITGDEIGKFGDASWGRGAITWGGGSTLSVQDNRIEYARTAMELTGSNTLLTLDDNIIFHSGSGLSTTGFSGNVTQITDTQFINVDTDWNDRFNSAANNVTWDFGNTGNTSDNWLGILAGRGSDTITGTAGTDAILTNQGNDTVHGEENNDSIFVNANTGTDVVDGGSETAGRDTLIVSNVNISGSNGNALDPGDFGDPATTTAGSPSATPVTFTMTDVADTVTPTDGVNSVRDISITASTGGSTVADEIEDVQFNLGSGGDTVNISGDFTNTSLLPSTIKVNGGALNDTVNATGLTSAHDIVFNGGGGNDTFFVSGAGGNDTFDGGSGTNTIDYSDVGFGVTVNLGNASPQFTGDGFDTISNVQNVVGTAFDDTLSGSTAGINRITGGGGVDTSRYIAISSSLATFGFDVDGHWTVTIGGVTDTFIGVEKLMFSDKSILLVDKSGADVGGFQTVQSAINAAAGGETILIRGGLTYSESHTTASGPAGIYINKAGLTLRGVTAAGALIADAATAQSSGPTIVSEHQNNFGANHWVDVGGDNTIFNGVHLKAGAETDNKVLEFWAENVTVRNSFVDSYKTVGPNEVYTFAVAIYINDNGSAATDEVTTYTIDDNILNEGIIVANGVGDPSLGIGANQKITDNQFIDTFDYGTGLGRYDTIVINGQVNGIGWLLEPTQTPTITGNTVANNTVPFILRGSDNSAANLPTAAQIAVILANNFNANVSYAYVVDSTTGDLVLANRNDGGGPYRSFAVTNTIDTLNLALDNTGDAVFGSTPRDYIHAGDTIIVQSGAGAAVDSQIMVDNLKVQATANSADLDLTMATTFANGSPIPGGVNTLTLTDYAVGLGANVDVTGNALANIITGNSGANTLAGAGGSDTLHGGGGNDALQGGVGAVDSGTADKATYDDARANYTIVMTTGVNGIVTSFTDVTETSGIGAVNEGHDTLSGIEVLEFSGTTFDLNDPVQLFSGSDLIGTFDTIQAAVDAAVDGNTVKLKALTYNENVAIHGKAITIDGVDDTLAGSVITGQITVDTTLDGLLTIKDVLINATGNQYGVFASANSTAFAGGITINNVTIENAAQNGFAYVLLGNGTTPTLTDTIGAITILNSAFSNNATTNTGSGGRGDILLYGYNQDLTITDVIIGSPGAFAQKAIQMRGIEGGDTVNVGPYDPAGDVAINNLTISGGYAQDAIAFYRIASFASFTGANNNVNVTRSVNANPNAGLEPWAVINFDEVGGTVDLTGFFASASNLASPDGIVPAVPSVIATPQGLATADTFTGTSGMDVLVGRGGSDTLHGGAGNDLLLVNAGDAVSGEIYDGGGDTDTLQVTGTANFTGSTLTSIEALTFATTGTSTVTLTSGQLGGGNLSAALAVTGDGNANHIVVNMPGTTVDLSAWTFTNWTDGVDTITINGSAANDLIIGSSRDDIIDPAGATSPPLQLADQYNVIHAGGGNDLMFSGPTPTPPHGFAGNVFDGGSGVDTVDYGNAPGAVSASLAAGRTFNFSNGYGGTDWFTDGHPWDAPGTTTVENLLGSAFGDILIGNLSNNSLSGRAGNDQLNGGGGIDQLFGGTGDDTFTYDLVTGGQATVDGGETLETLGDTQIVNGTAAAETWYINPISGGYLGIDNETGADTAATDANYEVRTKDVEEIVLNSGGGGDTVIVSGDLGGTGVATSTVTINGGDGNDILDASGVNGAIPVRVVLNGDSGADVLKGGAANDTLSGGTGSVVGIGSNNYTGDRAEYAGSRSAYTIAKTGDGTFTVTGAGVGTDTLTGVEGITFAATLTGAPASPPIVFELDSNSVGLAAGASTPRYDQSFVTDTGGFTGSGATTRKVDNEFFGVDASDGDGNYAVVTQTGSGPNTVFDGYRSDWTGGYIAKVDIYLDPTLILAGEGFDVSAASNKFDGTFLRDYFFHVTHDNTPRPGTAPTKLLVGGSNTTGAGNNPRQDLDTINNAEITSAGWYTFEWKFYEGENGALEVAMNLYNSSGNWLFTEVRNDGADLVSSVAGGNRYMWFTDVDVANGLAIDNVELRTVDDNPVQLVKGTGTQLGVINANTILQSYDTIVQALADAQSGNIIDLAAKDYTAESPVIVNVNNLTFRGPAGAANVDLTLGIATNVTLDRTAAIDVTGNASNNVITGNLGANTLLGLGGDDTLRGGGGNDNLQGGLQTVADTATYDDARANYTLAVTADASGFVTSFNGVTETSGFGTVNEGTDTLSGIELLQFSGTTLDINDAVQLFDSTNNLIGTFDDIKSAVDAANANAGATFTIRVEAGSVSVGGAQVMVNKNITIDGAGINDTTVLASADTGNASDARGMFLVGSGKTFNVSDLTLDGNGHKIYQAIRYTTGSAGGDIDRVHFEDMQYEPSGGFYQGTGIAVLSGDVDVTSSVFTNMGRIGVVYFGTGTTGTVLGSSFTGKGTGNWLDYAIEVGGGATAEITNNTVTGNLGVATVDGSPSAAFLATTAFGPGTAATLGGNTVTNSTMGLAAGNALTDTSAITFNAGNDFTGNAIDGLVGTGSVIRGNVAATGTTLVDGTYNWFGGAGANQVIGADLNDTLRGGTGLDNVQGNGGDDVLVWNAGDGSDTIGGGSNTATGDTLQVNSGASNLTVTAGVGNFTVGDGVGTATVSAVEEVNITLGSGTTATVTGDFEGTGINVNTITVTGAAGNETVNASAMVDALNSGPGDTSLVGIDFTGGAGNDTFVSGIGNDAFHGGADLDTAVYGANYNNNVTWDGTTATVTGARGSDSYDGIGKIVFNDRTVWLVNDEVGSEYTSLAQLFDGSGANGEAANGDLIILDDGTYVGDVTIDKAVTIRGANAGIAGTGSRGAESIIQGQLFVRAGVTIDGIEVHNTTNNTTQFIGVRIQNTAADVTVRNSLFYSTGPNGAAEDRGINMDTTVSGHVTIADNLFTGTQQTTNDMFSTANWHRGIWSDGGTSQLDITGNTLDHVRSGMNLDGLNNATTNVSGNTFLADGTGISVGNNYVGSPAALSLTAIHDNFFNGTAEDLNLQNLTNAVTFSATATNNTATESGTPIFRVNGGTGTDTLTGTAATDILLGHAAGATMAGNDGNTLTGLGGADLLIGADGTGADTAIYSGTIATTDITASAPATDDNLFVGGTQPGWTVNGGADGTDTLSEIEIVDGAGAGRILLVGNGGFATIADALAAAISGDTILIAPGTYNENLTVSTANLTIKGAGAGVVIGGTFKTGNYSAPDLLSDVPLNVWLQTHGSYSPASGTALTVAADNVTIENLKIDSFNVAIDLGNGVDHTTIRDVIIEDVVNGIRKGSGAQVTDLDLIGGEIRNSYIGMYLAKETADGLDISDVLIDGTDFINLTEKGIYAESLANALITGITMSNVGEFGRGPAFGTTGQFGNGIDINLKWDFETTTDTVDDNAPYSLITIENFTFTNVGSSDQNSAAASHLGGAAIAVKARNLGSYASPETASFLGAVIIQNGTIDGTSTGIRAGEPGQGITDPDVTITNVGITNEVQNATHGDVDNVTLSPMTVNMANGGDSLIAAPTTTGTLIVNGGTGNDTITTRDGADTINGGDGTDTVNTGGGNDTVIGTADTVNDSYTGGTGTDTLDYSALTALQNVSINLGSGFASGASIGTDTLSSFENANGGAGNDSLFGSSANNVLHGNGGIDNIVGSNGSDQLFGEAGTDTLNGGVNDFGMLPAAANDVLWGGADTDTFRFEGRFGDDSIGTAGNADWVDEENMVFVGYASVTPTIADVADGVLILIDDGSVVSSVFVAGATAAQMQVTTSISGLDLLIH